MTKRKRKQKSRVMQNLLLTTATAFVFALIIGNFVYYVGKDALLPGIHLDLFTFVSVLSFGAIGILFSYFFNKNK